jgi:N-acetylneuraminic acid mutarotase
MNRLKFSILMILRILFGFLLSGIILTSCKNDDDDSDYVGNWTKSSDFEGVARNEAVSFVVGDYAYVGSGLPAEAEARYSAAAFAIGTKGYFGTGYNGDDYLDDFWEYDTENNTWSSKAHFGGSKRYGAVGFSVGNKGYIATGYDDNYLKDLWEYDPTSDTWTKRSSLNGTKRRDASVFVIADKAYVVGGINNGSYVDDFCSYDPTTDTWTLKNKISDATDESFDDEYTTIRRSNAVAFSSPTKGYFATGVYSTLINNVWEYDPDLDTWTQKTGFEGTEREAAVGFTVQNRFFVTTGRSSGYQLDDTWEFKPDETYDDKN